MAEKIKKMRPDEQKIFSRATKNRPFTIKPVTSPPDELTDSLKRIIMQSTQWGSSPDIVVERINNVIQPLLTSLQEENERLKHDLKHGCKDCEDALRSDERQKIGEWLKKDRYSEIEGYHLTTLDVEKLLTGNQPK